MRLENLIARLSARWRGLAPEPEPEALEEPVVDPVEFEEVVVAQLYGERMGNVDAVKDEAEADGPSAAVPRR